MVRSAIILGSGEAERIPRFVRRIDGGPYEGVEIGVQLATSELFLDAIVDTNLTVTSVMTGIGHVEEPSKDLLVACRAVDCQRVVLGYLPERYFTSRVETEETADLLSECAVGLDEHGLTLCYHNHDHELAAFGDQTAFEILADRVDDRVQFEVDVGWIGVGGFSPVEFLERYGDRVPLIHLKDMEFDNGVPVPLGEGNLDVEGVIETANTQGIDWLIYEDESDVEFAEKIRHGAATLGRHAAVTGDENQ